MEEFSHYDEKTEEIKFICMAFTGFPAAALKYMLFTEQRVPEGAADNTRLLPGPG